MPPRIHHARGYAHLLGALLASATFMLAEAQGAGAAVRKGPVADNRPKPQISTETLPGLLQRGAQAFAAGDFAQAAAAFTSVEATFGGEAEWRTGTLPRRLLPLRGFAALRAGLAADAADDLSTFLERFPGDGPEHSFALYSLALALQQSGQSQEAAARFADFEARNPGSAQAALAHLQRAEIAFGSKQAEAGFALLRDLWAQEDTADSLKAQARLRALEKAVELQETDRAVEILFGDAWTVSTMPEIGVLAFAAMEMGDRLLATDRAAEAVRAYQLVPSKPRLVAAQAERLEELRRVFAERAPRIAAGPGLFWADYYQARITRVSAQLAALEAAADYTAPLRLRLGQALLLANRPREAWLCFERVAFDGDAEPSLRQEAHYRWILAAADLAHWSDALVIARAFVERYPASELAPEAFFLISRAHLEQQDYGAAETVLSDILEHFPAHPAALRSRFTRGWVRTIRENYDGAKTDFRDCINTAPTGPLAVRAGLWLGLAHHFAREREAALAQFDALIKAHPSDPLLPEILYRRATTLYAMRDLARARREMEHFVSTFPLHPRHPEALVLLGDVLMGEGDLAEALRRFTQVPPQAADTFVYAVFQQGKILRAQGDHAAMVRHFTDYVRAAAQRPLPRVSEALYHLAWAEEQRGQPAAALAVYADALARFGDDPGSAEVGSMLAALKRLDRRLGREENLSVDPPAGMAHLAQGYEAWLVAEREAALTRHQETYYARLTLALADQHLARKEPAQAELLVLDLARSAPLEALDAPALARVGEALAALGSEEADACFRRILAFHTRSPERGQALRGLAELAIRQRRFSEALAWTTRFDEETPAHPAAPFVALLAGEALEALARPAEAAERYDSLLRLKAARGRPHARALVGLARCAQVEGDTRRAIACLQRVYTLHRAQRDLAADAYLLSAPLFEALGDADAAAATYREMLALPEIGDAEQREQAHTRLRALEQTAAEKTANAAGGAPL